MESVAHVQQINQQLGTLTNISRQQQNEKRYVCDYCIVVCDFEYIKCCTVRLVIRIRYYTLQKKKFITVFLLCCEILWSMDHSCGLLLKYTTCPWHDDWLLYWWASKFGRNEIVADLNIF
jgi:hypothetical protein